MPRACLLAFLLLSAPVPARADLELPTAGQPEDFSGVVGAYRIVARAQPTEVSAEDPVILTIRITVSDPEYHPDRLKLPKEYYPKRLNLRGMKKLADFRAAFHIDDLPEKDRRVDKDTWEFSYRLRPRHAGAAKIPRLPFIYCKTKTGEPRTYEEDYTNSIPLQVKPRAGVSRVTDFAENSARLAEKYPLATGAPVLGQESEDGLPGTWLLALLAATPPLMCFAWYRLWRSWYPDAAEVAGRRRSRAARKALKALRALKPGQSPADRGARVASILAGYLHQRLELPAAEPTPAETTAHLEQAGVPPAFIGRFAALFRECDAARFSPLFSADADDLAGQAARLIRELEAEPCMSRAS